MSHFNLAIFTLDENPNLDEIMEPFSRGIVWNPIST